MTDGQIGGLCVVGVIAMLLLIVRRLVHSELPKRGNLNVLNMRRPSKDDVDQPED